MRAPRSSSRPPSRRRQISPAKRGNSDDESNLEAGSAWHGARHRYRHGARVICGWRQCARVRDRDRHARHLEHLDFGGIELARGGAEPGVVHEGRRLTDRDRQHPDGTRHAARARGGSGGQPGRQRHAQLRQGRPLLDAAQAAHRRRDPQGRLRPADPRQGLVRRCARERRCAARQPAQQLQRRAAGSGAAAGRNVCAAAGR